MEVGYVEDNQDGAMQPDSFDSHGHGGPLSRCHLFAFPPCEKVLLLKPANQAFCTRNVVNQTRTIVLQYCCLQIKAVPGHLHRMRLLLHIAAGLSGRWSDNRLHIGDGSREGGGWSGWME